MSQPQPTTTYLETISSDTDTPQHLIDAGDVQPRTVHAHHDGPASSSTKAQVVNEAPVTPKSETLKKGDQSESDASKKGGDGTEKSGMGLYGKGGLLQFGLGP
ncbi:hypothetical protein HK097_002719 [Rhizophlyctis rosea]|uniref:Uncharacterized protein n=1 Tax=Rhizophlyctis rosea TaxID=64517 RepID=A0AAD5SGR3_9FUNG|nr:hypothetical protein HK097_002719 [Rhizophlyctis rosea]